MCSIKPSFGLTSSMQEANRREYTPHGRFASLRKLKLPSPKATLVGSSVVVICVWLVSDFVFRDPSTILFAFITLGSDFLIRNLTSGFFVDRYWPVVAAAKTFSCFCFFFFPALGFKWVGSRQFSSNTVSALILCWLLFYLATLTFLFKLELILRAL